MHSVPPVTSRALGPRGPLAPIPLPGEAHLILGEVDAETAYALWRALTDAELWVSGKEADGLFWSRTQLPLGVNPDLVNPLIALGAVSDSGGSVATKELSEAAAQIWEWAERREMKRTALLFAELAARLEPDSSERASTAGRLCRPVHDFVRGTRWYIRAARLARAAGRDKEFAIAHLGWGNMEAELGRFSEAKFHAVKAYRAALRVGLRSLAASAYHDLLAINIHEGHFQAAWQYARDAVALYKVDHPRYPALAHDVAFLWGKLGMFSSALPIYVAVLPKMTRAAERLVVLANIARAAAASHDRVYFQRAQLEVLNALDQGQDVPTSALYHLGRACQTYQEWADAERLAERATVMAPERLKHDAVALLRSIAAREPGDVDQLPPEGGEVDEVRATLLRRLTKHDAGSGEDIPPERYPIT
jgi:tetratricopeptide (TPR) repeat protein